MLIRRAARNKIQIETHFYEVKSYVTMAIMSM